MTPHRFQVNKFVTLALKRHHPWVYRSQCSSALGGVPHGALVRLVGIDNRFLGLGLHDPVSAIAIRVFHWEDVPLEDELFEKKLLKAWDKRVEGRAHFNVDGFRWVHGEADGLPGVVIDVYGKTAVCVFYLPAWEAILTHTLQNMAERCGLERVFIKIAHGQNESIGQLKDLKTGVLTTVAEPVNFHEGELTVPAYPATGLKTGFFLDLREVRTALAHRPFKGKSALNIFANDGVFSALLKRAGAARVVSVERHETARAHAKELFKSWQLDFTDSDWLTTEAFDFLKSEQEPGPFDLIILDPPSLASRKEHLPKARAAWIDLIKQALKRLAPGGELLAISCTERLSQADLMAWTQEAAKKSGLGLAIKTVYPATFDHPSHPDIPERDYLTAIMWRRT
jgi:23S rRNA (cytosine1962-C5)-methyltransferase